MNEPKILFISRKLPPQVGGMEQHSAALLEALGLPIFLIGLRKKQHHLIWWIPFAFLKGCLTTPKIHIIYVQDALLTPVGVVLGKIFKKPVVVTAHGLDIIFHPSLYQRVLGFFLPRAEKIICVSRATKVECEKRGIDPKKIVVIPNGIFPHSFLSEGGRSLLLLGRLVERKGVPWFIREVLPKLPKDIQLHIVGSGPFLQTVQQETAIDPRVVVHGRLSNEELQSLWRKTSVFVMPNIQKEGDMEGFGITALEAGSWGAPTVAADLEGLTDAILEQKTGALFAPNEGQDCLEKILSMLSLDLTKRKDIKSFVQEQFDWKKIGKRYEQIFYSIVGGN